MTRAISSTNKQAVVAALNRLLEIHYRSLPMYLAEAIPWTHPGDEEATRSVADIVASHQAIVRRVADEIQRRGGIVESGEFPVEYTDLHFLSLDFLLRELVAALDRDLEAIQDCAAKLQSDPTARTLAGEALGQARGHRQTLAEFVTSLASRP